MILIEDLTSFVVSLLIGIIGLNLVFFLFVLWRRLTRQSFFKEKDSAKERFRPVVQDLLAGKTDARTSDCRSVSRFFRCGRKTRSGRCFTPQILKGE